MLRPLNTSLAGQLVAHHRLYAFHLDLTPLVRPTPDSALADDKQRILIPYFMLFAATLTPQSYVIFDGARYGAQVRVLCLLGLLVMAPPQAASRRASCYGLGPNGAIQFGNDRL